MEEHWKTCSPEQIKKSLHNFLYMGILTFRYAAVIIKLVIRML